MNSRRQLRNIARGAKNGGIGCSVSVHPGGSTPARVTANGRQRWLQEFLCYKIFSYV